MDQALPLVRLFGELRILLGRSLWLTGLARRRVLSAYLRPTCPGGKGETKTGQPKTVAGVSPQTGRGNLRISRSLQFDGRSPAWKTHLSSSQLLPLSMWQGLTCPRHHTFVGQDGKRRKEKSRRERENSPRPPSQHDLPPEDTILTKGRYSKVHPRDVRSERPSRY